jgi:streptogramin lyase
VRKILILLCLSCAAFSAESHRISTIAGIAVAGYSGDGGEPKRAELRNPYGLSFGPDGALYICDMENHVIRRIKDGIITTIAGNRKRGYSGDGGPALKAELNEPYEVRFDKDGNIYFVEMRNHLVRRVSRPGIISTIAGTGKPGFSGDGGPGREAQLNQPHSIQLDQKGNLFICDIGNHRIRHVNLATGLITTFAGTGEKKKTPDGARFAEAPLNGPRAIDFDSKGTLWLALREGNAIFKLNLEQATIHHVAGTGEKGFQDGPARTATLSGPKGISVGPDENIYFADTESHSIRRVNLKKGVVETLAGTGQAGDGPDGDARMCGLARPHGIFVAPDGKIYIGDSENNKVRVITTAR